MESFIVYSHVNKLNNITYIGITVLKSEMVTPSPVPLNNAFIYKRKQLPLVGEFWLRTN